MLWYKKVYRIYHCENYYKLLPKAIFLFFFLSCWCGFYLVNPNLLSAEDKQISRVDILIFSPHPEDEIIACAGVILKALKDCKTIKIVFLTNGEAFSGQERRHKAQNAAKKLGLNAQDEIFLSFPDKGLLPLWEGDNRQNLLRDIKDILNKYKPKKICMPYSLDIDSDHKATAYFVSCILAQLRNEGSLWLDDLEVSNYLVNGKYLFSQMPNNKINIAGFKDQKQAALNEYCIQSGTGKGNSCVKDSVAQEEIFWDISNDKEDYLNQLELEWKGIAKTMRQYGFNVNFGPVIDTAGEIEDRDIYLVKRQRLYSEDPEKVIELTSRVIKAMDSAGIIPVLKHFPGLGDVRSDTHIQLPISEKTKESLYSRNILPFKDLINKYPNLWVMVDHVIYPCLSDKPASLSYEIQTTLLRKELGFTGIIIADELLNMQALLEYAYREKISEPFIGEIIVMAFQAGTDIALIYLHPEKAQAVISHIIQSVTKAVREGRLKPEDLDNSVERILKEKERIFGKPLLQLIKKMSLEEKICQKIAVDIYSDTKLLNKYNLCGIRPRVELEINALQNRVRIPLFIMAQHEGGAVNERLLNLTTRSAYIVGREFERLADKKRGVKTDSLLKKSKLKSLSAQKTTGSSSGSAEDGLTKIETSQRVNYDKAISSLLDSMDNLIKLFSELQKKGVISPPHPNYLTPLTVNSDNNFEFKPFNHLPVVWLRSFPDDDSALYAYKILKSVYQEWIRSRNSPASGVGEVVLRLISLRESIEKFNARPMADENK